MTPPFRTRAGLLALVLVAPVCWAQAPAPAILKPVLDEAAELEHRGAFADSKALYDKALNMVPGSRHARLGLARIARAEYRFGDARAIYEPLLQADPGDAEAANGMAWLALANYQVEAARAGFNATLAREPGNAEAKAGLAGADTRYRYQLDVSGGQIHNDTGTAWTGGAQLTAALDAMNSVEIGLRRNSRELVTGNPLDLSTLPSNSVRLGYSWRIPGRYGAAIAYEHRDRENDPTERRVDTRAHVWLNDRWQVYGGLRKGFGSGWKANVAHAGALARISGPWEISATVFSERRPGFDTAQAVVVDVARQGPGTALLVLGVSRGDNPRLTDVHGSVVWPVGKAAAITATARHSTFRDETQVEFGWRQYWN